MSFICAVGIVAVAIGGTLIAGAVLHWREREARKNGNGFEHLKRLVEK